MTRPKIDLPFDINRENFPHQQFGDHYPTALGINREEIQSTPGKRKLEDINEKQGLVRQPKKTKEV